MSELITPISALGNARYDGFAAIREIGPTGMITLRCKQDVAALPGALRACMGLGLPEKRRILTEGQRSIGWMGPDELLLILPYAEVAAMIAALTEALKGEHVLVVDVSDARAMFRIEGPRATEVLAKLCPVDLPNLAPGELRRTRAAQVPAALWQDEAGFTLVGFRSVAGYLMGLLTHSAMPGSELFPA